MKVSRRVLALLTMVAVLVAATAPVFASGAGEDDGEIYIPVISKGFQHQFWQTVMAGAEDAAEEFGVDMVFEGPTSEAAIQEQAAEIARLEQKLAAQKVARNSAESQTKAQLAARLELETRVKDEIEQNVRSFKDAAEAAEHHH